MLSVRTRRRLRTVDAAYRQAILTGPLWSYDPGEPLVLDASSVVRRETHGGRRQRVSGPIDHLVVDGRCLQHPDYADRGIGRYTRGLLGSVTDAYPDLRVTIILDHDLPDLDQAAFGGRIQLSHTPAADWRVGSLLFLDPAPMTLGPSRLDRLARHSRRAAIVYDFIPAVAPRVYLATDTSRSNYIARLGRLATFDHLWTISQSVASEARERLGLTGPGIRALPLPVAESFAHSSPVHNLPATFVFASVGADRRKNLPGAVAAFAGLTHLGFEGDLVVLSHMPDAHRRELNTLADSCGLESSRIHAVAELASSEVSWLYKTAVAVVIPSFGEGLSLPILESVDAGTPVVASDIAPHRELLGSDEPLCDPAVPSLFAAQLKAVIADCEHVSQRQREALSQARSRAASRGFDNLLFDTTNP